MTEPLELTSLAVARVLNAGLRDELRDAQAIADRRARDAYRGGLDLGLRHRRLYLVAGVALGLALAIPVMFLVLSLA